MFSIEGQGLVACHLCTTGQAKDVVYAARPREVVVGKVAFPATSMMDTQRADFGRRDRINDRRAQNKAEFELPRPLKQRPTLM
jgi:hypothetical protein